MRRLILLLGAVVFLLIPPAVRAQGSQPFLGQILIVGFNFAPEGWAFCDGSLLPLSENTALFSLLGTTYGGNGTTTFALPDLRGRVPIGSGQGPGLSDYELGALGGQEVVTLTIAQMPAHTHPLLGQSAVGTTANPTGGVWGAQSRLDVYSSATPDSPMGGQAVSSSGGGLPYSSRSPYLTINYIIALAGVYPSRS
jgi:microcystin-dependent protein